MHAIHQHHFLNINKITDKDQKERKKKKKNSAHDAMIVGYNEWTKCSAQGCVC